MVIQLPVIQPSCRKIHEQQRDIPFRSLTATGNKEPAAVRNPSADYQDLYQFQPPCSTVPSRCSHHRRCHCSYRVSTPITTNTTSSIHLIDKKTALRSGDSKPVGNDEDLSRLWINSSVSLYRFEVCNRRNGLTTITQIVTNGGLCRVRWPRWGCKREIA